MHPSFFIVIRSYLENAKKISNKIANILYLNVNKLYKEILNFYTKCEISFPSSITKVSWIYLTWFINFLKPLYKISIDTKEMYVFTIYIYFIDIYNQSEIIIGT